MIVTGTLWQSAGFPGAKSKSNTFIEENVLEMSSAKCRPFFWVLVRNDWVIDTGKVILPCKPKWSDSNNTWRNNNVVITSKRRHFDVITSKWRCFDVITTSLLRNVFAGKVAHISQTTFSNAFPWMKIYEFRLISHWSLFLRVRLSMFQPWFR